MALHHLDHVNLNLMCRFRPFFGQTQSKPGCYQDGCQDAGLADKDIDLNCLSSFVFAAVLNVYSSFILGPKTDQGHSEGIIAGPGFFIACTPTTAISGDCLFVQWYATILP